MRIPRGGIAFFDSGIGGMTVLATCEKYLHGEILYYYGDNGHAPYGNLSPKKIRKLVLKAFEKFQRLRVRAVVIACNTATALCVEELRKKYDFPIIGAEPAVYSAVKKGGQVWVLTTRATFKSERFRALCARAKGEFPQAEVIPIPCDQLAGEIERWVLDKGHDYTAFLPVGTPTSIVLGCTHYIYIEKKLKAHYRCEIYHGNEGIARRLCEVLEGKKEENRERRPPRGKIAPILGFLTTLYARLTPKRKKDANMNKSSHLNSYNPIENKGKTRIVFLGKYRKNNENIYKKTYVCGVWGESGAKREKSG